jgi:hypothetical protein
MEARPPRSGDGTLLGLAQFPGAFDPMAAHGLIGINSFHVLPHRTGKGRGKDANDTGEGDR